MASRQIMYFREVSPRIPLQRCTHVEFTTKATVAVTAVRAGKLNHAGDLNCWCCFDAHGKHIPLAIVIACAKWCASHKTKDWTSKCSWSKMCDGCPQCAGEWERVARDTLFLLGDYLLNLNLPLHSPLPLRNPHADTTTKPTVTAGPPGKLNSAGHFKPFVLFSCSHQEKK